VPAAYALGALMLAGEAAVHIQQFASSYYAIRWIGPLFIANAAAGLVVVAASPIHAHDRSPRSRASGSRLSRWAASSSATGKGCSAGRSSASAPPSRSP
jgi:hypothetical protein